MLCTGNVTDRIIVFVLVLLPHVTYSGFRPSLVSIGLIFSEEKIFEKAYDVRRRWTPSDGNSSQFQNPKAKL
jgi:hypothetical protein